MIPAQVASPSRSWLAAGGRSAPGSSVSGALGGQVGFLDALRGAARGECRGRAAQAAVVPRFGDVVLAANLVVAAVVALWPRAAQRPGAPATTAGVGPRAGQLLPEGPEPATALPTWTRAHLAPGVLWQRRGSAGPVGGAVRYARPLAGGLVLQLPELCLVRWGQLQAVGCRCLRGGLGAALWGQGTGRLVGHRWRPRPPDHRIGV
jgi:hypothetical protein